MPSPRKKRMRGFTSRAIAFYNPWPEMAGKSYDVEAIFNGVDGIGRAFRDTSASTFNHHDNVDCESFGNLIKEFIKECKNSHPDQAVLYICTHGVVNRSTGELHLMMNDSKDPNEDESGFYATSISGSTLRGYIEQLEKAIPDGRVLVLLDSCYAGALRKPRQPSLGSSDDFAFTDVRHNPAKRYVQGGSGCVVFMSSGPDEKSLIDGNPNISENQRCPLFTKAVVETLRSPEFQGQPIDLEKLVTSVKRKVEQSSGGSQHPFELPPHWSKAGKKFGNVGFGPSIPEDMEVDERYEHIWSTKH